MKTRDCITSEKSGQLAANLIYDELALSAYWKVKTGLAFPTLLNVIISVVVLVVGACMHASGMWMESLYRVTLGDPKNEDIYLNHWNETPVTFSRYVLS